MRFKASGFLGFQVRVGVRQGCTGAVEGVCTISLFWESHGFVEVVGASGFPGFSVWVGNLSVGEECGYLRYALFCVDMVG